MEVMIISSEHDLARLTGDINQAQWDESNEMSIYDEESLRTYLEKQDTVFVACYDSLAEGRTFMGMASGRIEMKPYAGELWFYVDEVDVCVDQRQKGAGKCIMKKLIDIAEEQGCEELWLGTEVDNHPANALYKSLGPDDVGEVVGYTFETDD